MEDVYALWVVEEMDECEAFSLIGVFSSKNMAADAIKKWSSEHKSQKKLSFDITRYRLNIVGWSEGFVSV